MAGSRRTMVVLVTVGAVLAGSAAGAGFALFGGGDGVRTTAATPSATPTPSAASTPTLVPGADDPDPVVAAKAVGTAYLDAWETGDWLTMQGQLDSSGGNLERALGGMNGRLGVTSVSTTPGEPAPDGGSLPFSVTLTLEGLGEVTWSTELTISRNEQAARSQVHFTAASVYPTLKSGQRLELVAAPDSRGDVLDRKGRSLAKQPDLVANVVGRYDAGSGSATGLQRVLADDLGGEEKRSVGVVDVQNKTVVKVVKTFPGSTQVPGVRTTLDVTYQQAATKALAGTRSSAAIVAIDVRTGEVRAVANRPYTGVPPALSGRYAPGSTFKIVTALAALRNGKTPSSTVKCPTTINSYGKIFKNHEKAPNRSMSLTEAFADSCNTAFIGLARSLPEGALASAAEDLGFNADQRLPVASFGGSYPTPKDNAELAASAIGQGRVEASPLQMASVAAAVASGTYRQPRLLADCPDCVTTPIPEAAKIRPMMRAVVTSGTGTAAAGVAGGPVYGKTGTAEFGSGTALQNHAWFVGWQGTTAFAVFVDVGASGGETAAPIAARFLRGLAS
ncbi:MAG: penicillin-binding protein [Actinobacteria bacterium]|nr:penicillin-binding protein [Actinomycetota bacterium]